MCERTEERAIDYIDAPNQEIPNSPHEVPIIGEQIAELHERADELITKLGCLVFEFYLLPVQVPVKFVSAGLLFIRFIGHRGTANYS